MTEKTNDVEKTEKKSDSKEKEDEKEDVVLEDGAYEALIPISTNSISPFLYLIVDLVVLDDHTHEGHYVSPSYVSSYLHNLFTFTISINAP